MTFTYATPALLFPAVSLLFLSYSNRFLSYANLIRTLHTAWIKNQNPLVKNQIIYLRKRMSLIRLMQIFGATSLLLCTVCMAFIYLDFQKIAELFFLIAVFSMAASLITLIIEIFISMNSLDTQLEDMS